MRKTLFIFISVIATSCSPKIATSVSQGYASLNLQDKVIVYSKEETMPQNAKIIGKTSIGDSGFTTNCDYETMLEKAKNEARKNGANAIRITEHILPNFYGSSCHRIKAQLLKIENVEEEILVKNNNISTVDTAKTKSVQKSFDNQMITYNGAKKESNFLLLANIGQSFRVAATPKGLGSEQREYMKKLKSGLSYDFSAYYLKDSQTGIGIKYNVYKSDGLLQNQEITFKDGTKEIGSVSDDITISFIGPSFIISENENAKTGEANLELALGYISYKDQARLASQKFTIKGGNLGMIGGMGYHFRLTPHFLIGPQVNFVGGVLKKFKLVYSDGRSETIKLNDDELENLWRIDLSIGAKFRF
jgi:hypothetical protein